MASNQRAKRNIAIDYCIVNASSPQMKLPKGKWQRRATKSKIKHTLAVWFLQVPSLHLNALCSQA